MVVRTHEHLGLQFDPTVPPGPEGPAGVGAAVLAAETCAVAGRTASPATALELPDDTAVAGCGWGIADTT